MGTLAKVTTSFKVAFCRIKTLVCIAGDHVRGPVGVVLDLVEDIVIHRRQQMVDRFVQAAKFDMSLVIRNRVHRMLLILGKFSAQNLMEIARVCRGCRLM